MNRAPFALPRAAELQAAADLLNAGSKVAILAGAGALGATDAVIAVADRLQACAAKVLPGKAALPDDLPWVTGSIGILGTKPSWEMMNACDTLLMIGTGFPYAEFLPLQGQARAVQIDIDPLMLGIRYATEVNLQGDCMDTLHALLPLLRSRTMAGGAGSPARWAELITVAKYWKRWADPRWIVCAFNNRDLNHVTWEQRVMEGDPKFEASQDIPDVPYHRFAELIGLKDLFCDGPERVGAVWQAALMADRPVLLEFKTDPEVPPLPSHISFEQARHFAGTMVHGDPKEGSMLGGVMRQLLSSILPKDKA